MTEDEHNNPPTVAEISVHLGYMSKSLDDIKNTLKNAPSRVELEALDTRVKEVEGTINSSKNRIVIGAVTVLVGMILAVYNLSL